MEGEIGKGLFPLRGFKILIFIFFPVDDYEDNDAEFGSASKKRRTSKTSKLKKSASSRSEYFCPHYAFFKLVFLCIYIVRFVNIYISYYFLVGLCFIRLSTAVNTILQKLCTVLGLLKDLLLIERLSDSCILQLVKTSITTFLVDNIQLLQLKAISLLSAVLILLLYSSVIVIFHAHMMVLMLFYIVSICFYIIVVFPICWYRYSIYTHNIAIM